MRKNIFFLIFLFIGVFCFLSGQKTNKKLLTEIKNDLPLIKELLLEDLVFVVNSNRIISGKQLALDSIAKTINNTPKDYNLKEIVIIDIINKKNETDNFLSISSKRMLAVRNLVSENFRINEDIITTKYEIEENPKKRNLINLLGVVRKSKIKVFLILNKPIVPKKTEPKKISKKLNKKVVVIPITEKVVELELPYKLAKSYLILEKNIDPSNSTSENNLSSNKTANKNKKSTNTPIIVEDKISDKALKKVVAEPINNKIVKNDLLSKLALNKGVSEKNMNSINTNALLNNKIDNAKSIKTPIIVEVKASDKVLKKVVLKPVIEKVVGSDLLNKLPSTKSTLVKNSTTSNSISGLIKSKKSAIAPAIVEEKATDKTLKKEVVNTVIQKMVENGLQNKLFTNKSATEKNSIVTNSTNNILTNKSKRSIKMPIFVREKDVILVSVKDARNNIISNFSKKINTLGKNEIEIPTGNLKKGKYSIFMVGLNGAVAKGNLEINQ